MNIGIVGLGLIGGSMAKAIKTFRNDTIYAFDKNQEVLKKAMAEKIIDGILDDSAISRCDLLITAIYPKATIEYIEKQKHLISPNTVVIDCCGVKEYVCQGIAPIAQEKGFIFVGGHPMAGKECAGYDNSFDELFLFASMILTPYENTPQPILAALTHFFHSLGFGHVEITTAEIHDRNIAFTSQLAHIVSNAYVKSPRAEIHRGFSAGSYKDLTRVAKLEEAMWAELFLENKDNLLNEIETIIGHMKEYAIAMETDDSAKLQELLKIGRERKEAIDEA